MQTVTYYLAHPVTRRFSHTVVQPANLPAPDLSSLNEPTSEKAMLIGYSWVDIEEDIVIPETTAQDE